MRSSRKANLRAKMAAEGYGTESVMVWLLVSLPDVAVTVIVELPGGVPLTGACVVWPLHAGNSRSSANITHRDSIPAIRLRRPFPPIPTNSRLNPGTINQIA